MSQNGLKIPHIQRIKRSNGRIDLYFRKGDYREGPLSAPDGSAELAAIVKSILDRLAQNSPKPRAISGTVKGALESYNKSADFLMLARSTQRDYQYMIDELTDDLGDVLLRDVSKQWLTDLRDVWASRGHRAANNRLQLLKNAFWPIISDDSDIRIIGDPFRNIQKVKRPHDAPEAHTIWEQAEFDAVVAECLKRALPGMARALALGRYGGFRRGTICAILRNARTKIFNDNGLAENRMYWVTEKRKITCDKREDPRLTDIIEKTPNRALTIAYNAEGEPLKERQFNQSLSRVLSALNKKGLVRAGLTIHGLRHTRGVELADAGASDAEIMSQLEHSTPHMAVIYRRQADRRRMSDAAQDKVDNVIKLKAGKTKQKQSL